MIIINGTHGDDDLEGTSDPEILNGLDGNDTLNGNRGSDTLNGGAGDDLIAFYNGTGQIDGGSGSDTLYATGRDADIQDISTTVISNVETLVTIFVVRGTVAQFNGFGTIRNLLSDHNYLSLTDGGTLDLSGKLQGHDRASVSLSGQSTAVTTGAGYDTVWGGAGDDTMNGGAGDDWLIANQDYYGGGNDLLNGGSGNDELDGRSGDDTLNGGSGGDYLYGYAGADQMSGGNDNDSLDGGAGADRMAGGAGNDSYFVDSRDDHVYEYGSDGIDDGGHDSVRAVVSYRLGAFLEDLELINNEAAVFGIGNDLDNRIIGNRYDNVLRGMDGNDFLLTNGDGDNWEVHDKLYGGAGNDTYYLKQGEARAHEDTVSGVDDGGVDTVIISSGNYTLGDFIEILQLADSAANGTGNGLDNQITGNSLTNKLNGMGGADTLYGGGGNDNLTGGEGADDFVFAHFGTANGNDHLKDFVSGLDHLVFTAADYGWTAGHVLTPAELSLTGAAVGISPQFVYDPATLQLYWDADGADAGGAVKLALFENAATPQTGDFVFV